MAQGLEEVYTVILEGFGRIFASSAHVRNDVIHTQLLEFPCKVFCGLSALFVIVQG